VAPFCSYSLKLSGALSFGSCFETDPLEMFRQITPNGDVTRTKPVAGSLTAQIDGEDEKPKENMKLEEEDRSIPAKAERRSRMFNLVVSSKIWLQLTHTLSIYCSTDAVGSQGKIFGNKEKDITNNPLEAEPLGTAEASKSTDASKDVSTPDAAVSPGTETAAVHEEMAGATPAQCPYIANQKPLA
jgi:hypothetical protein